MSSTDRIEGSFHKSVCFHHDIVQNTISTSFVSFNYLGGKIILCKCVIYVLVS